MLKSSRRRLHLPETFAFTTIGVFTVASFACGNSGTGASSSSSSGSTSGMGGASSSSSSHASSSSTSASSTSTSSSSSGTCTPDGGMCVMADAGNTQTIYSCIDIGVSDAGCPKGYVCSSSDCPMNCEPLMNIYCPGDAGCEPSPQIFVCTQAPDAGGGTKCPTDYVCTMNDCPPGCIGEPIA